ncbi:hypothetical protein EW026_g449 [Hermanssonia centrifuga]|uniref:Cystathionine gamma-synthase n=1 Tax=Hermanssonia centrifuga TaxID=98765 RepID=A0A4S4KUN5_9APHY|nr:hypothetical protein EW026_g449 [Hermanssonia centrifuga]
MAPKGDEKTPFTGTDLIHADDHVHRGLEVAPSISVTTTFRNPEPWNEKIGLDDLDAWNPSRHVYSRYTQGSTTRVEKVLSKINGGYAVTYASGLAASYAALVHLRPKRIAITGGYHGCHMTIDVYKRSRTADIEIIGIDDEYKPGDLCWLETPLNPTGEARDIKYYADKIHAVGGKLIVDSTFAPPPLQYPFKWGADVILHSGTKYFGGHSDLLCGVLVVKTLDEWKEGKAFDGIPAGVVDIVWHASLQGKDARRWEPSAQMEGGWNPTFAILLKSKEQATLLPHATKYFIRMPALIPQSLFFETTIFTLARLVVCIVP